MHDQTTQKISHNDQTTDGVVGRRTFLGAAAGVAASAAASLAGSASARDFGPNAAP